MTAAEIAASGPGVPVEPPAAGDLDDTPAATGQPSLDDDDSAWVDDAKGKRK